MAAFGMALLLPPVPSPSSDKGLLKLNGSKDIHSLDFSPRVVQLKSLYLDNHWIDRRNCGAVMVRNSGFWQRLQPPIPPNVCGKNFGQTKMSTLLTTSDLIGYESGGQTQSNKITEGFSESKSVETSSPESIKLWSHRKTQTFFSAGVSPFWCWKMSC